MRNGIVLYVLLVVVGLWSGCNSVNLNDAREQYLRGEYYAASESYRELYRRTSPKQRGLRGVVAFEMAENYRRLNQSARAAVAYENAIRYGYPDTMAYLHRARMSHREGQYDIAAEVYRRFLEFSPENDVALNGCKGVELARKWLENPTRYEVRRMDVLNGNKAEFSPMLSPDGSRLYFSSSRDNALGEEVSVVTGLKYNDLYCAVRNANGEWQRPERLESGINTEYDEGTPSFSSDGEWMYYTYSDVDPDRPSVPKIYLSRRGNTGWGEGVPLEVVDRDSMWLFAHPAISPSGRFLYFVSDMPGGYGGKDIWRAEMEGPDKVVSVKNLGPEINTAGDELFPYSRNDTTFYFSSDGHPGMGGLDIFEARYMPLDVAVTDGDGSRGKWCVSNLQYPVNSQADDFGITFESEGESGFFSSNRSDVRGYDHIYSFAYPELSISIEGIVVDEEDAFIADAVITIVGSNGAQFRFSTGEEGVYRFKAQRGVDYLLMASAEGFLNQKQSISIVPEEKDTLYYVDFEMIPYNRPVLLENIFYDFNSALLRDESKTELDELVALLNEHPSVSITLAAHTDRKGSDEYNMELSLRRANAVVDYLIANGIDKERLSARGYGKSKPVVVSKKMEERFGFLHEGDILTEEFVDELTNDQQHVADQINRRTSFEVADTRFGLY